MPAAEYPSEKACRVCGEVKPLSEFYAHPTGKDGHRNQCKPCRRAMTQRYRRENYDAVRADTERRRAAVRQYLVEQKQKPCADCGGTFPHFVMDYHHLRDKEELVSRLVQAGYNLKKVKAEIAKCVLLCANCHRIRHGPPTFQRTA